MYYRFIILLLALVLQGCISHTAPSDNSTKSDISIAPEEGRIDSAEPPYDQAKKKFQTAMRDKHFFLTCLEHCSKHSSMKESEKNFRKLNIETIKSSDSLSVNFSFVHDCCQDFGGDIEVREDTLYFSYFNMTEEACACYCRYCYRLELPLEKKNWKAIVMTETSDYGKWRTSVIKKF